MSTLTETIEEAAEEAEEKGCIIIESDESTLLLDYDSAEAAQQFENRRWSLEQIFGVESIESWPSKSGGGHVHYKVVLLQKLTSAQRIALQAAMGSDWVRELFAVERDRLGKRNPSILFQPKEAVVTVVRAKPDDLFASLQAVELPF